MPNYIVPFIPVINTYLKFETLSLISEMSRFQVFSELLKSDFIHRSNTIIKLFLQERHSQ